TGEGVTKHVVNVPAGTRLARFALYNQFVDGPHDLDLYVEIPGIGIVGASGGPTADELVDLVGSGGLPPGSYNVYVHGFNVQATLAHYTLFYWLVDPTSAGNLT